MKDKLVLTALLSVLAAVSVTGAEGDDQQERKKLTGVWKGFAVEGRGENPDRGPVKLELTFSERSIKGLEFKGTNVVNHGEGDYTLDLTNTLKILDAGKANERGRRQNYVGIYALDGDMLKWCVSPRKDRPKDFRTGDGAFLLILKRQKP